MGMPAHASVPQMNQKPYARALVDERMPTAELTDQKGAARQFAQHCKEQAARETDPTIKARLTYEEGRVAESLSEWGEAARFYQMAHSLDPTLTPALAGLARTRALQSQWEATLAALRELVERSRTKQQRAAMHLLRSLIFEARLGKCKDARAEVQQAHRLHPSHAGILAALARCARRDKDWPALDSALAELAERGESDIPWSATLTAERARIAQYLRKASPDALRLYQLALARAPLSTSAALAVEPLLCLSGDTEELIQLYVRRAQLLREPTARAAHFFSAASVAERKLDDTARAVELTEEAWQVCSDDLATLRQLADLYERRGDAEGLLHALDRLDQRLQNRAEQAHLNVKMGRLLSEKLDQAEEAIERLERARSLDPAQLDAAYPLIRLVEAKGQHQRAYEILTAAEKASNSVDVRIELHLRMARCCEKRLNRADVAIAHHQAILSLQPEHREAFHEAVRLLEASSRWEEVTQLHERAVTHARDDDVAIAHLLAMGQLLEFQLHSPERAITAYQRILERRPDQLTAHHCLQRAARNARNYELVLDSLVAESGAQKDKRVRVSLLHQAGLVAQLDLTDASRARTLFEQALTIEPTSRPTLDALARLHGEEGRPSERLKCLARLLRTESEPSERAARHLEMARILENELTEWEQALQNYGEAWKLGAREAFDAVVRILERQRQHEELADFLESALAEQAETATRARTRIYLGEIYEWTLGQLPEALKAYQGALEEDPQSARAHAAAVRVLEQGNEHKKTVQALLRWREVTTDPALILWLELRSVELLESLDRDSGAALGLLDQLREREPAQSAALYAWLRSCRKEQRADALGAILKTIEGAHSRSAVLHELLVLDDGGGHINETTSTWDVTQSLTKLDPGDLVALRIAELEALSRPHAGQLAEVDAKLASAYETAAVGQPETLAAMHRVRLGDALVASAPMEALAHYRSALERDPAQLGAVRGMTHIAESWEKPALLEEVADLEGKVTRDKERAARCLLRAAELEHQSGQTDRAIEELDRALMHHPESMAAAQMLHGLLSEREAFDQLVQVLSRAAESCRDAQKAAAHWVAIARVTADRLDDLPQAIAILSRLDKTGRATAAARLDLAEYFGRDRQWKAAVSQLEQALDQVRDRSVHLAVHLHLAEILHERLECLPDAARHLREVLELDSHHQGALRRLLVIQMKEEAKEARETVQKLIEASSGKEQAEGYLAEGILAEKAADPTSAAQSYARAIAIVGLQPPDAAEKLRALLEHSQKTKLDWQGYEKALAHFAGQSEPGQHQARVLLELADVVQRRSKPAAIASLRSGLQKNPASRSLRARLARLLKDERRFDEATVEYRQLYQLEPESHEVLAELIDVCDAAAQHAEAHLATGVLVQLGGGSPLQQSMWQARQAAPAAVAPGSFGLETLSQTLPEPVSADALSLLQHLSPLLGKILPARLDEWGVSPRDKLPARATDPLRTVVDRVSHALGGVDVDLYVSPHTPRAGVLLADPVALILPSSVSGMTESMQVFVVARYLTNVARSAQAADALSTSDLELALFSGARLAAPALDAPGQEPARLEDLTRRLSKALPWLSRGRIEDAARRYASTPPVDTGRMVRALEESSFRAALLLSDDLSFAQLLRAGKGDVFGLEPAAAERIGTRLFGFWASQTALKIRRETGMLA